MYLYAIMMMPMKDINVKQFKTSVFLPLPDNVEVMHEMTKFIQECKLGELSVDSSIVCKAINVEVEVTADDCIDGSMPFVAGIEFEKFMHDLSNDEKFPFDQRAFMRMISHVARHHTVVYLYAPRP